MPLYYNALLKEIITKYSKLISQLKPIYESYSINRDLLLITSTKPVENYATRKSLEQWKYK